MPKIVDKNKVKQKILLAFQECLSEKNIAVVTMRDIAKKAEMSHPSLLNYFSNRKEIVLNFVEMISVEHIKNIKSLYSKRSYKASTPMDIVKNIVDSMYLGNDNEQPDPIVFQVYALAQTDEEIKMAIKKMSNRWIDFINELLREISYPQNETTAKAMLSIIDGIFLLSFINNIDLTTAKEICNQYVLKDK